jgi:hypothetical protein
VPRPIRCDPARGAAIGRHTGGDQCDRPDRADGPARRGPEGQHDQGRALRGIDRLTELSPGPQVTDDAALRQWVLNNTGSYYHFVGSCKVDTDNTHATTVMIAERAGNFIKATA